MMKKSTGIDIGTSSIKIIELLNKKGQLEIVKALTWPIKTDDLKSSLKEAIESVKLSSRHINTSLSGQSVIVRYIEMPLMKMDELRSAIKFEAEKYISFDINDAIIDCAMLDKIGPSAQRVLLAVAKKDKVGNYVGIFKELDLEIDVVDIDSFALFNAFQRTLSGKREEGAYAIINIGAKLANMNISTKGSIYFTRDIMWGGADITNRIKDALSLSFNDAETLKCSPGERKDEIVHIIMPSIEKFVSEIRMSLDYFESQSGKNIERFYISGGTAYLCNIIDVLKETFSVDVILWDPFEGIKVPDAALRDKGSSQYAVALGLALR